MGRFARGGPIIQAPETTFSVSEIRILSILSRRHRALSGFTHGSRKPVR